MSEKIPVPRLNVTKSLQAGPGKTALVLAGGGIAGGVYELGVLRALDDLLLDRTVNDFHIYVGTSAGSLVAAGLANGLSPETLFEAINGDHPEIAPVVRRDLLKLDSHTLFRRTVRWPAHLLDAARHYWQHSTDLSLLDLAWQGLAVLPPSLYDSASLERYARRMLLRLGASNDFARLHPELDLIATDLQSSQRAVFSREETPDVPISQAISASSAVPLLYKPVKIGNRRYVDGAVRGNASLDLAVERGATLVIAINPLAPLSTEGSAELPEPENMQAVINQVLRTVVHANLHYHIKHLARLHPEVDFIVIEPAAEDAVMAQQNVMRYSARQRIFEHAYQSVSLHLAEHYRVYSAVLAHHHIPTAPRLAGPALERIRTADNSAAVLQQELSAQPSLSYRSHAGTVANRMARAIGQAELAVNWLAAAG